MNFDNLALKKQQTHRITLEIDVTGDEADFARCEKLGTSFLALISQVWWLADSRFEFSCTAKVKLMPQPKTTHAQVQLPQLGNGKVRLQEQNTEKPSLNCPPNQLSARRST